MSKIVNLAKVEPWNSGVPTIHGPDITGASANKPFSYSVPTTGERPLSFKAEGLPEGLRMHPNTGHISGIVAHEGEYTVILSVENKHGGSDQELGIAIGKGLALTPPMGWNSWNAWRRWVDDKKVRAAADALVTSGLAARGYTYVNVDSCWQGERGGKHNAIQPNRKFPDMKALVDYVHSKGLKFGIYSTPWVEPWGCDAQEAQADWGGGALVGSSAGDRDPDHQPFSLENRKYVGKDKYEPNDIAQWTEWEIDFLKYDWAPTDPKSLERMSVPLKAAPRDIILSVCTDAKLSWADAYLKHTEMWRGLPDTEDQWNSVLKIGFYADDYSECEDWRTKIRPGKWNDLDMTALGPQFDTMTTTKPNRLSSDEQITHMTMWALYPSPLILSCDLSAINDFELRLFGNEEVLAVNQDRLGIAATRILETRTRNLGSARLRNSRIQARPLADGSTAVGVFNLSDENDTIRVFAEDLNIPRGFTVRNLWERRDMGSYDTSLEIEVPSHGAQMLRLSGG